MGKKSKKSKKTSRAGKKKHERALARRVERFVDEHDVSYDDLAFAGIGLLATTVPGKKHKKQAKRAAREFEKLKNRGRRLAPEALRPSVPTDPHTTPDRDTTSDPDTTTDRDATAAPAADVGESRARDVEPVISYQPRGGGWYAVEIDDIEVDRVQGEERAAARAGELLTAYASSGGRADQATTITHSGGGWYDVIVRGVPVDRLRGRDPVLEKYGHLDSAAGD